MITRVIAVDPGKMTGIAWFDWEPGSEPVLVGSFEVEEGDFYRTIEGGTDIKWTWKGELRPDIDVRIACESFTITADTVKKTQAPFSLELIGVLKHFIRYHSDVVTGDINMQKPADAKTVFPNEKLKKLGYWHVGGAGHANDAIRHGLLYLAKHGWMPSRLI